MTPAVLAAALAGVCAALAVGDAAPLLARPCARGREHELLLRAVLAVGRRLGRPTPSPDLAARIAAAGTPFGWTPADVVAIQLGGALLGGLAALAVAPPLFVPTIPALAVLAPRLLLHRRTGARAAALTREVADVLDLLRVATAAGLPLDRALGEVGRRQRGVLAAEFARAAAELRLGVAGEDVLARLALRTPDRTVAQLALLLTRAARQGAPIDAALGALASDARAARARRIAEHGAKAAPKVQLVVSLVQVPAVLLVVAAALLTTLGA